MRLNNAFSSCIGKKWICFGCRAVTVADFYHRGGNGPTTAGGVRRDYK